MSELLQGCCVRSTSFSEVYPINWQFISIFLDRNDTHNFESFFCDTLPKSDYEYKVPWRLVGWLYEVCVLPPQREQWQRPV